MLRLLALILIFVLFLRGIGILFRMLGGGMMGKASREFQEGQRGQKRKPSSGNVNIDYVPDEEKKKDKGFKGGDYVDYEEVQ